MLLLDPSTVRREFGLSPDDVDFTDAMIADAKKQEEEDEKFRKNVFTAICLVMFAYKISKMPTVMFFVFKDRLFLFF